jgi:hypothetical protein
MQLVITRADVARLQADVAKLQASPPPPPPPPAPPPPPPPAPPPPPPSGRTVVAPEAEAELELLEADAKARQREALRRAAALLNGAADSEGVRALRAILAGAEPTDEEAPYPSLPPPPPVPHPPAPIPSDPWAARPPGLVSPIVSPIVSPEGRDRLVDAAVFDEAAARRQLRTLQQAQRLARQMRSEMEAEAAAAAVVAARSPRPGAAVSGIAEWMEKYTAGWREAQPSTVSPGPPPSPPPQQQRQQQQRQQWQQRQQRQPRQPRGGGIRGLPLTAEAGLAEPGPAEAVPYASREVQVRARRDELDRAKLLRRVALIERHATVVASSVADS